MDFDPVQAMRIRDVVHHGTSRDASGTLLLFSVERARFTIDESGSGKERHASMNLEARLDRHHARREGGVPTLSVVSYPRGRHDVNAWAERHSRRLVRIAPFPFAAAVAKALLDSLEAKGGLVARAVEVIAERNGSPPAMRSFDLDGRGRPELEIFLRNALAPISDRGLATLVAAVLETNGAGVTAALDDDLGRDEVRWREILSAIVQILPSGELPVVLFEPGESRELPPDEFRAYVDELARRVEDAPPLPAFLIGPREMLEDAARGRSRAALLVREGLADSDGVDPESVAVSTGDASVEVGAINRDGVLASAAWIDRETPGAGLGERLVDIARAFEEMVESERPPLIETIQSDDGAFETAARSEAEAFLFAVLEALPDTRGVFESNGDAGFAFGSRNAEIDLLGRAPRVALEVDGWPHFRDPERYRTDRRKDVELQRRGWFVVRVLAEDVVCRLEGIVRMIRQVLSERRARGGA